MPADPYHLLGVPRTAKIDEIRRAYRRLARELHPDVNASPDATARFAEIQHAYETLSDPHRRHAHDHPPSARSAQPAPPHHAAPHYSWTNVAAGDQRVAQQHEADFDEIYDTFFAPRAGVKSSHSPHDAPSKPKKPGQAKKH